MSRDSALSETQSLQCAYLHPLSRGHAGHGGDDAEYGYQKKNYGEYISHGLMLLDLGMEGLVAELRILIRGYQPVGIKHG